MMRDHHFQAIASLAEVLMKTGDLLARDTAALPGERTRGVEACDKNFAVAVNRVHDVTNNRAIAVERRKEAARHVKKRHIVITRHHELRLAEAGEKGAGGEELAPARALREVAADHHEGRRTFPYLGGERLDDDRNFRAEMQIGNMGKRSHGEVVGF